MYKVKSCSGPMKKNSQHMTFLKIIGDLTNTLQLCKKKQWTHSTWVAERKAVHLGRGKSWLQNSFLRGQSKDVTQKSKLVTLLGLLCSLESCTTPSKLSSELSKRAQWRSFCARFSTWLKAYLKSRELVSKLQYNASDPGHVKRLKLCPRWSKFRLKGLHAVLSSIWNPCKCFLAWESEWNSASKKEAPPLSDSSP